MRETLNDQDAALLLTTVLLLTTTGTLDDLDDKESDERILAIQEEMEEFEEMTRTKDQLVNKESTHINSVDDSEPDCQLWDGLLHEAGFEDRSAFSRKLQANFISQDKKNKHIAGYISSYDHAVSESIKEQFENPGGSFTSDKKLLDPLNYDVLAANYYPHNRYEDYSTLRKERY